MRTEKIFTPTTTHQIGIDMGLVNWPVPDPTFGLKDSGEGGLFAYMVVRLDEDGRRENCCIDSLASLSGGGIDVTHSDFFPPAEWVPGSYTVPPSDALSFCAFLGSTTHSLYSDESSYFKVKYDHLTQDGKRLYDLVTKIYGQPTILTFLDT